jgi:hypothetical protein
MTIKDVIEKLSTMDPETIVDIDCDGQVDDVALSILHIELKDNGTQYFVELFK